MTKSRFDYHSCANIEDTTFIPKIGYEIQIQDAPSHIYSYFSLLSFKKNHEHMKYIHVSPTVHKAVNNAHKVEYKRNDIYKERKGSLYFQ